MMPNFMLACECTQLEIFYLFLIEVFISREGLLIYLFVFEVCGAYENDFLFFLN